VMQATGFSGFRLARPVVVFGLIVALLMSILTHFLVPASRAQLSLRSGEIQENITARLLSEGTFLHPTKGITFFISQITPQGALKGVFLHDQRDPSSVVTYTASDAMVVRSEDGPKMVMFDGIAMSLEADGQRLSTTSFDESTYDIGGLITQSGTKRQKIEELGTASLIAPSPEILAQNDPGEIAEELHGRIAQPLLCLVGALVGFCTLILGGFSRFGVWKQILGAVVILIVIKMLEGSVTNAVRDNARLWVLIYTPSLFGIAISCAMLWISAHPTLFKRTKPMVDVTGATS